MEFRVLGPIEATRDGRRVVLGHARLRAVLAVLLVEANHTTSVDQLMDRVWGDAPPRGGREVLYSYLSRLRRSLAPDDDVRLERHPGGYLLAVDEASIDLYRFRALVGQARAATAADRGLALFDDALRLWHGTAFADLDTAWLTSVRAALDVERRAAELDRTDVALRLGHHADLLADLAAQADRHPLDERVAGQVMLALYRSGRPADALEHYRRFRTLLADQLGTDPNPSLLELHQRILTADPRLAAPQPATTVPNVTPRQLPPAPAWFTGRTSEFAALTDGDTVLISALAGAGGIGKTWLALHWAHLHTDRFPDGQLFVDLRGFSPDSGPLDPLTAVRGFLDALGVDPATVSGGLAEHTARYRSQVAGKRMLILLDNAATADQVIPLLPGSPSCTVIVTSRKVLTSLITRHSVRHVNLDVLSDTEARTVFAERLGHARVAAEPDAVAELVTLCGRYPLALAIMASRAQTQPDLPLADLAAELRDTGLDALADTDPATSVPTVLSWSTRGLTAEQRTMFALLGIAPGPDIGLPAAASLAGLPPARAHTVLRALVEASLLDRGAHGRYAMHDLVRTYAAATAREDLTEETRLAAQRRIVDFYARTAHDASYSLTPNRERIPPNPVVPGVWLEPPPDAPATLAWFDIEHRNLRAAQHRAATLGWHDAAWHLAWGLYSFLFPRGLCHDQVEVWRIGLDAATHLPDPRARTLSHVYLGMAHTFLSQHEDAVRHLRQALHLAESHDNPVHQARAHHMLSMAWQENDYRRALEHARHALDIYRELDNPSWLASTLNTVGWCAAHLGDYDTARAHCQDALAIHRRCHGLTGEAATLDSLGYIDHHSGHHQQAVAHYDHALTIYRDVGSAQQTANTLDALGHPHVALGHTDQARAVWEEALELYRRQGRDLDADRVRKQLAGLDTQKSGS